MIDLKLDIYGTYRDDTFIPWLHGIDNLLVFKQALEMNISDLFIQILILL